MRVVSFEDLPQVQKVLFLIFELPCDRYLAFRFVATEIIKEVSYVLSKKDLNGNYYVAETERFIKFAIDGIKNKNTREISSNCLLKLCSNTKTFIQGHTTEIINNIIPDTIKDWKCTDGAKDILEAMAILIS